MQQDGSEIWSEVQQLERIIHRLVDMQEGRRQPVGEWRGSSAKWVSAQDLAAINAFACSLTFHSPFQKTSAISR